MAKKGKGNRIQVILECTEHKTTGLPGTSRYITIKNRKNTPQRLELKKYNPILKKMTVHRFFQLSIKIIDHGKESIEKLQSRTKSGKRRIRP